MVMTLREPAHLVDSRARTLWRIPPLVVGIPIVVAAIVIAAVLADLRWPMVAVALLAAAACALGAGVVPQWRYRFHRWEVGEEAVYTQSGWFTRHRVIIPIARIQIVDTEAVPLDQLLGLATLTVTTASSAGTVRIVGLDAEVARRAAADLTARTQAHTGDAT
ncbi:PH domain-containing protein [Gordonia sp. ABSL1-1]|uniref:PH domain-containing protein n=1 Tax=Gordonia sp. ABSL1-1 TaxID=3053923 RepID=UPI0025742D0C|nr:PH domain-containing protein [Gordonia sp. ABSL1-1]MDL9936748.1 PH domain-containing protein [Gordonia sp. ABSL1-1]